MAVAHNALLARLGLQICFARNSVTSASTAWVSSARAPLRRISVKVSVKAPGWASLMTLLVGHGVSLLHWRSGGVEHHHDTPPYRVTPSPTSGHSSPHRPAFTPICGAPDTYPSFASLITPRPVDPTALSRTAPQKVNRNQVVRRLRAIPWALCGRIRLSPTSGR
jgi:hypothetical protein